MRLIQSGLNSNLMYPTAIKNSDLLRVIQNGMESETDVDVKTACCCHASDACRCLEPEFNWVASDLLRSAQPLNILVAAT